MKITMTSNDIIKKILEAIQQRRDLNPKAETFDFELGGFGVKLDNENDYFTLIEAFKGLKLEAGIAYEIIDTSTLYESHKCKIAITDKKKFEKFYKQTHQSEPESTSSNGIYYNPNTGIGYAYGNRFKFKNDQPDFFIFSEMYKNINKPIPRSEVLKLANYEEGNINDILTTKSKRKIGSHVSATYLINEIAKKM